MLKTGIMISRLHINHQMIAHKRKSNRLALEQLNYCLLHMYTCTISRHPRTARKPWISIIQFTDGISFVERKRQQDHMHISRSP